MKLHFIISSLTGGGAERVMVILANSFANKNYDISLISLYEGQDAYQLDPKIKRISLSKGRIKNRKLRALVNLSRFYNEKSNRPDVIISFITLTNLISVLVAKLYGIKIIISEHNSHLQAQHPKYLTNFTRNYIYRKANYVTVLTAYDIDFYRKKNANVVVMPNPCTFTPITTNNHKRDNSILAIGNLNRYHHKGFDNLITLIKPVLKENPGWNLKIIGGGDEGLKHLKSIANGNGIDNQIVFTGFINNVNEYMRQASIFILPSRYEGLPMVLLEAMSQGMACIAYDCKTGPSDIIENHYNGIIVEDQNAEELKIQLTNLIQDSNLRMELSNNGINSLGQYSIESISEKWEAIFKRL